MSISKDCLVRLANLAKHMRYMHPSNSWRVDRGNRIELSKDRLGTTVLCTGAGNEVIMPQTVALRNTRIIIYGEDCSVLFGEGVAMKGMTVEVFGSASSVKIGAETTFEGGFLAAHWGRSVSIGRNCMFSSEVDLRTTDSHSIVDVTGARINPDKDIEIADRVWIARGVTLLKGCKIGTDSVIGAKSIVSGTVPPRVVAVGCPARVIKSGISWTSARL